MITALSEVISVSEAVSVSKASAVRDDKKIYTVQVSCQQKTSCGSCQSQKSCGTGIVSKAFGNKSHAWQFQTNQVLKVGDMVEIGLPDKSLVLSSLVIYLFPLLAMILGSAIAHFLNANEGIVILAFFLSGLVAFFLAKPLIRWLEATTIQQVSLIRVLGQPIL